MNCDIIGIDWFRRRSNIFRVSCECMQPACLTKHVALGFVGLFSIFGQPPGGKSIFVARSFISRLVFGDNFRRGGKFFFLIYEKSRFANRDESNPASSL